MNNIYVVAYDGKEYYRWFRENVEVISKLKNCRFEYASNYYKIFGNRECYMCFNERSYLRSDIQSFYYFFTVANLYLKAVEMNIIQEILDGSIEQMLFYLVVPKYKDYLFLIEDRLHSKE